MAPVELLGKVLRFEGNIQLQAEGMISLDQRAVADVSCVVVAGHHVESPRLRRVGGQLMDQIGNSSGPVFPVVAESGASVP